MNFNRATMNFNFAQTRPLIPVINLRPALPTALSLVLVLLLNACVSQSPMPAHHEAPPLPQAPSIQSDWNNYQQILGSIEFWQVQGKLGIRTSSDSGSAYLNWEQQPKEFAIHLSGPLGQGSVWIRGDQSQVSLERAGEDTLYAATPELLMLNAMGWWLPVSDLYYWVKGIPAPNKPVDNLTHNSDGTLLSLQQNHWQLSYPRYQQLNGWHLPSKVIARYQAPGQDSDIKLTFIIKDWQLNNTSSDDASPDKASSDKASTSDTTLSGSP
ncbi:lipoprotein insertase outer membrane protein LolB [Pseudomaricurvus sp.]|uniref:lipoprotein insertase outer membrane protein LolB n=1 Tax=Pseudomaricurvus sp. TaxID=2004510 RepID=UPI003F6CF143